MITIILPISRKEYLLPIFKCLDELKRPDDTELLLLIDGDKELEMMVDHCLNLIEYTRVQVRDFGDSPAAAIDERRYRISNIHNFAKQFIPESCDTVFLLEDDTTFEADALERLYTGMNRTGAIFIQGVEVGRWKSQYIGAWQVDNIYDPSIISSVVPGVRGLQEIDAGGLYCALMEADRYLEHIFEPFDRKGKNGLSCDVNLGLDMRRRGYKCFMDWNVQCGHYKESRKITVENSRVIQVVFEKDDNGKWLSRGVSLNEAA